LYRRLADLHTIEAVEELQRELEDRFGPPPPAVQGLIFQLRIKLMANFAHASGIISDGDKIGIKLPYLGKVDRYALQDLLGEEVRVSRTAIWIPQHDDDEIWMLNLLDALEKLATVEAFPAEEAT
jgi:transcription-repair coupling factor (superfamily II helicase)